MKKLLLVLPQLTILMLLLLSCNNELNSENDKLAVNRTTPLAQIPVDDEGDSGLESTLSSYYSNGRLYVSGYFKENGPYGSADSNLTIGFGAAWNPNNVTSFSCSRPTLPPGAFKQTSEHLHLKIKNSSGSCVLFNSRLIRSTPNNNDQYYSFSLSFPVNQVITSSTIQIDATKDFTSISTSGYTFPEMQNFQLTLNEDYIIEISAQIDTKGDNQTAINDAEQIRARVFTRVANTSISISGPIEIRSNVNPGETVTWFGTVTPNNNYILKWYKYNYPTLQAIGDSYTHTISTNSSYIIKLEVYSNQTKIAEKLGWVCPEEAIPNSCMW